MNQWYNHPAPTCPWCFEDTGLLGDSRDDAPDPLPPCPHCGQPVEAYVEEDDEGNYWWELDRA